MDKVEHDFSAIEQALAQNEAPMRMRERIGKGGMAGLVILATGMAVTLSSLGIGKGIFWAKEEKIVEVEKTVEVPVEKIVEIEKIVEVPMPAPSLPQVPPQSNAKIVRNYTIFQNVEVPVVAGKHNDDWFVTAGHNYETSQQRNYDNAYCYATSFADGVSIRVNLSTKSNVGIVTDEVDLGAAKMGVGEAELRHMRSLCPYL
ncbi:hypothetical protein [Ruegeria sp. HKCCD7296]|nr:hypothetical protein [Ruegeria sp. HKCCD7296]